MSEAVLFCLNDSCELTEKISKQTGIDFFRPEKTIFKDGEMLLRSPITVRNKNIFIVASFSKDVNSRIMECLIFLDSLKRCNVNNITLVLTYYGYARQDRKARGREPITAKLVANILQVAGVDNLITVDLHNPSIQGFFNIPVEDVIALYVLADKVMKISENFVIAAPDYGSAPRAKLLAGLLNNNDIAIVNKRRVGINKIEVSGIIGEVKDRDVIIIDDIIDTGSSVIEACKILKDEGARRINVIATHGVFSNGFEIFEECSYIENVFVTDSIDQSEFKHFKKHNEASLFYILSMIIENQLSSRSLSKMYIDYRL